MSERQIITGFIGETAIVFAKILAKSCQIESNFQMYFRCYFIAMALILRLQHKDAVVCLESTHLITGISGIEMIDPQAS